MTDRESSPPVRTLGVQKTKCVRCSTMVAFIWPYPAHKHIPIYCERHTPQDWSAHIKRLDHTEELARAI